LIIHNMRAVISSAQMREIDRLTTERCGTPSLVLMENAAAATARLISERWSGEVVGKSVLVMCGRGNNGGDGAATARLLALAGARVDVILFGKLEDTRGDARANFDRLNAWKDERALREDRNQPAAGAISFYEC